MLRVADRRRLRRLACAPRPMERDFQDDLAANVAGRAHLLSPAGFRQRQYCVDEYLALAGIDELRDLGKRRRTGRVRVKDGADAVPCRLIRCRWAEQRNENAALAQRFPRTFLDLAAKCVKDNIDIGSDVLEASRFVVNGLIDPKLP